MVRTRPRVVQTDVPSGGRRRPIFPVALVSVTMLLLTTACLFDANYVGQQGPRVSILGSTVADDSVTALTNAMTPAYLIRRGLLDAVQITGMQAEADKHALEVPDALVLELGTYDIVQGRPVAQVIADLDAMLAKFPSSCIVLTTVNEHVALPGFDVGRAQALNAAIAARADHLLDWNTAISSDVAHFVTAPDNVAPTPDGRILFGVLMRWAVDSCFGGGDTPEIPVALTPSGAVTTTTPTFSALFDDPNNDAGAVRFTVKTGTTIVASGTGTTVPSGSLSTWTPPAALLPDTDYLWQAQAVDAGGHTSPSSGFIPLRVQAGREPVYDADFADPVVRRYAEGFVGFSTNSGLDPADRNIQGIRSESLGGPWELIPSTTPGVADGEMLPDPNVGDWVERNAFGAVPPGNIWAPAVGVFPSGTDTVHRLYYTAHSAAEGIQCIGVATSTVITGPYDDAKDVPIVCQDTLSGSIDPEVYNDPDGQNWLLWKDDSNGVGGQPTLWAARLSADGLDLTTAPLPLLRYGPEAWESAPEPGRSLIEQPTIVDSPGHRWLFYSGSNYQKDRYAEGYAECPLTFPASASSPVCTRVTTTGAPTSPGPWLASDPSPHPRAMNRTSHGKGPGAAAPFIAGSSGWWFAYHGWTGAPSGADAGSHRALFLDKLRLGGSQPGIDSRYPYEAADIDGTVTDGRVVLGVNAEGDLNAGCGGVATATAAAAGTAASRGNEGWFAGSGPGDGILAADGIMTTACTGIRFLDPAAPAGSIGEDGISPGCPCEGWGIADDVSGRWGGADRDQGVTSLSVDGSTLQPSLGRYLSRVKVGPFGPSDEYPYRVDHDYRPAIDQWGQQVLGVYEVLVTVTNDSPDPAHLHYRRVMDWDIPPNVFNEYVSIGSPGARPASVEHTTNNGFDSVNPLETPVVRFPDDNDPVDMNFTDLGPKDHGSLFQFDLGTVAPAGTKTFRMYYGAQANLAQAMAALGQVRAQIWSVAKPSVNRITGAPNTFLFGYREESS